MCVVFVLGNGVSSQGEHVRGTVKNVFREKSFGFIKIDDGRQFFFHRSDLVDGLDFDQLSEGQTLEFEEAQSPKGPRAKALRPV